MGEISFFPFWHPHDVFYCLPTVAASMGLEKAESEVLVHLVSQIGME